MLLEKLELLGGNEKLNLAFDLHVLHLDGPYLHVNLKFYSTKFVTTYKNIARSQYVKTQ